MMLDAIKAVLFVYERELFYLSVAVLSLGMVQSIIYTVQIIVALSDIGRIRRHQMEDTSWSLLTSKEALPMSMIIPTYNEETTIEETLLALLGLQYPSFEVVVVNDGSTDNTLELLIEKYKLVQTDRFFEETVPHQPIKAIYTSQLYPSLVVVDKPNGKRADALNAGIDVAQHPLFCTVDADSLLDASALLRTVNPFLDDPEKMVATGGTVRILNGCKCENGFVKTVKLTRKVLPLFQVVEYMRSFLMGRMSSGKMGVLTTISGAFSVFKRDIALEVGGFDVNTLGEDFEMVLKIHKYCRGQKRPYAIKFMPEPVCWTEVPETYKGLASQRIRWQQGALEVFFKYRHMFLNPRYGRIGMVAIPITLIFDVLGPLAELLSYILVPLFYVLGILNTAFFMAAMCLLIVFGVSVSVMSLVIEEVSTQRFSTPKELGVLVCMAILENFGYRQLNNIWRIQGWWRFLRKNTLWGVQSRGSRL